MIHKKKKMGFVLPNDPTDLVFQGFNLLLQAFQLRSLARYGFLLLSQFSLDIIFLGCDTGVKFLQHGFKGENWKRTMRSYLLSLIFSLISLTPKALLFPTDLKPKIPPKKAEKINLNKKIGMEGIPRGVKRAPNLSFAPMFQFGANSYRFWQIPLPASASFCGAAPGPR